MQRILQTTIHTSPDGKYCLARCKHFSSGAYCKLYHYTLQLTHQRPIRPPACKRDEVEATLPDEGLML